MQSSDNLGPVDLRALLAATSHDGPVWSLNSEQLNVNLIRLDGGAGIASHVNGEVDVLIVAIEGAGLVTLDGQARHVKAGDVVLIPRGMQRAIRSGGGAFAYLTCHRRRAGLMPA